MNFDAWYNSVKNDLVDFLLLYKGRIRPKDLSDHYGFSHKTAQRIIKLFRPDLPAKLTLKDNVYLPNTQLVKSILDSFEPDPLTLIDPAYSPHKTHPLATGVTSKPLMVEPEFFTGLIRVLVNKRSVSARALNDSGDLVALELFPLALLNLGSYWGLRVFYQDSMGREGYRTIPIHWIEGYSDSASPGLDIDEVKIGDSGWNTYLSLMIGAHPRAVDKSLLQKHYFSGETVLSVGVRQCYAGHFLRSLAVDCSDTSRLDPSIYPFIISGKHSVEQLSQSESRIFAPGYIG